MTLLRNYLVLILLGISISTAAQGLDSLPQFNADRLQINKVGMTVLGSWALGNMAVSGIALSSSEGVQRSFHQMNVGWNAVNLVIAGFGYYGATSSGTDLGLAETVQEHESIKRILLFNAGLDLAYMAGGAYLLERAKSDTKRSEQLKGFGQAVIMNGAFLFVFDLVMYALHNRHGAQELYPWLDTIQLSATGVGLQISF